MRRPLIPVVALVLVAGVAGCGGSGSSSGARAQEPSATTTGSAWAPDTRGEGERAEVLLLGDSVMATLTPALRAALGRPGREARFSLYPSLPRAREDVETSAARVVGEAEVVIVLMGIWQGSSIAGGLVSGLDPDDPTWPEEFREEFVLPWVETVTASGAEVIWVAMTRTGDPLESLGVSRLNAVFRDAVNRVPSASYIDAGALLADADGRFQAEDTDENGETVRLHATDGIHLCPAGAARIADAVVPHLPPPFRRQADPDWQSIEGWEDDELLQNQTWYEPGFCL